MNEFKEPNQPVRSDDAETKRRKEIERIKERIFDRETPEAYKELAKKVGIIELQEPYAENLRRKFYQGYHDYPGSDPSHELSELGRLISEKAKEGTVLDLGCGATQWLSSFFRKNQAELYIGVDLEPYVFVPTARMVSRPSRSRAYLSINQEERGKGSEETIASSISEGADIIEIPKGSGPRQRFRDNILELQDDMLCAISRMKDESVDVIVVSGLEKSSVNPEETKEYFHALDVEIRRVLKKSGIVLDFESDVSVSDMERVIRGSNRYDNWEVLRKSDSEAS